jgi:hypothetical protein
MGAMIFHNVIQASEEWHKLRRGVPTSSNFDRIMTPKKRELSSQAQGYICELIGETFSIYGPERPESYVSNPMRHGIETEAEARRWICMEKKIEVSNGGFCTTDDGRFGASPDALINPEGCCEIKCPTAKVHTSYLLAGVLPTEYVCQIHGQLIVTKYVDFVSYHPGLPLFGCRVEPDDFTVALRAALEQFWIDYQAALTKIRSL